MTEHLLIYYETRGSEVYESENGPTIGYDNISRGFTVVPEDFDDYDGETYRTFDVIGRLDDEKVRELHLALSKIIKI